MKELRQVFLGVVTALVSGAIILGSLSLALVEGGYQIALAPSATLGTGLPPVIFTPLPGQPTFTMPATLLPTISALFPTSSDCPPPPPGWVEISILPDDTLAYLAQQYGVTLEVLDQVNCLYGASTLIPGTRFYVPNLPPTATNPPPTSEQQPTRTARSCGPPRSWVTYIVRPGDTLYSLGQATGVTVAQLQTANCLGSSIVIRVGQPLYVPFIPIRIPTRTATQRPTATLPPTATRVSPTLPPPASPTPRPSPTSAPTPIPPTPTEIPTEVPTTPPLPPPTEYPTETPPPPVQTEIPSGEPSPAPRIP